jgi:hypothetical protein
LANAHTPLSTHKPKRQTEQVQVTWEDQRNINEFSWLNMRRKELEALIAGVKVRAACVRCICC